MPKASRTLIECACYHIITRGNQQQKVFKSDDDYTRYLTTVKKAKKKYNVLLYSYCLMPNHTHLLVEPGHVSGLSGFMHWVNRGYTAYFNAKYRKVGHLWQGRFKSKPIVKGQYLINCAEYIEANPVRAEMVTDIAAYPWSSYNERCLSSSKNILDEMLIKDTDIKERGHV
jgi:putative transposase